MTERKRRLSPSQWQMLIEQWQVSGLSATKFCHEHSLGYATFCKWRKHFTAQQPEARRQPDFIDLGALSGQGTAGWNIVLHLGDGVELRLSRP